MMHLIIHIINTSVIPYISLDQYLKPNLYTIPNMQNMRFFCCPVYRYVASVRPFTLLWSGIILKQMVVHSCQVGVVIDDLERVIFIRGNRSFTSSTSKNPQHYMLFSNRVFACNHYNKCALPYRLYGTPEETFLSFIYGNAGGAWSRNPRSRVNN